jgi:hypothetical protein
MKTATAIILAIIATSGSAFAADYWVGVEGTGFSGVGGAGLNLYSVTDKGLTLVGGGPYILQQEDVNGHLAYIMGLSISPKHDFVYVAYSGTEALSNGQPILVGFQITPNGLVKQWEQAIQSGADGLNGGSLEAMDNYVIENTRPCCGLVVTVINESGQQLLTDSGSSGRHYIDLVSGYIEKSRKFYYSCRDVGWDGTNPIGPANTVVAYDLKANAVGFFTGDATPLFSSTDLSLVQSVCSIFPWVN